MGNTSSSARQATPAAPPISDAINSLLSLKPDFQRVADGYQVLNINPTNILGEWEVNLDWGCRILRLLDNPQFLQTNLSDLPHCLNVIALLNAYCLFYLRLLSSAMQNFYAEPELITHCGERFVTAYQHTGAVYVALYGIIYKRQPDAHSWRQNFQSVSELNAQFKKLQTNIAFSLWLLGQPRPASVDMPVLPSFLLPPQRRWSIAPDPRDFPPRQHYKIWRANFEPPPDKTFADEIDTWQSNQDTISQFCAQPFTGPKQIGSQELIQYRIVERRDVSLQQALCGYRAILGIADWEGNITRDGVIKELVHKGLQSPFAEVKEAVLELVYIDFKEAMMHLGLPDPEKTRLCPPDAEELSESEEEIRQRLEQNFACLGIWHLKNILTSHQEYFSSFHSGSFADATKFHDNHRKYFCNVDVLTQYLQEYVGKNPEYIPNYHGVLTAFAIINNRIPHGVEINWRLLLPSVTYVPAPLSPPITQHLTFNHAEHVWILHATPNHFQRIRVVAFSGNLDASPLFTASPPSYLLSAAEERDIQFAVQSLIQETEQIFHVRLKEREQLAIRLANEYRKLLGEGAKIDEITTVARRKVTTIAHNQAATASAPTPAGRNSPLPARRGSFSTARSPSPPPGANPNGGWVSVGGQQVWIT